MLSSISWLPDLVSSSNALINSRVVFWGTLAVFSVEFGTQSCLNLSAKIHRAVQISKLVPGLGIKKPEKIAARFLRIGRFLTVSVRVCCLVFGFRFQNLCFFFMPRLVTSNLAEL